MKKFVKLSLAALMVIPAVTALSSCGGGKNKKTIVFYHTMGDKLQAVLDTAVEKFEAKYPGWKIEHSQVGDYDGVKDTIIGDLQGGTQPDLAYCYADHVAQYITSDKIVDMKQYMNSTDTVEAVVNGETVQETIGYTAEEIADIVPGYLSEGLAANYADYDQYGFSADAQLTLPYVKSTEALYYNVDALAALGKEVPETWDDLWDVCKAAKEKWPSCTPLGYDSENNWFITMCEQNNWGYTSAQAPHYIFNGEKQAAWLDQLKEYYDSGYFTDKTIYKSYTSGLFTKGAETGSIFSIGSTGGASNQASNNFKWGVAQIPGSKLEDGTVSKKVISQGPSLCMFKTESDIADEKQVMTWEFVKMLLDPTYQCSFAMTSGYNPSRISAYKVSEYAEFLKDTKDIVAVTANVASTMTDFYFTSPAFVGSSTARTQVGSAFNYVMNGTKTGAVALADAKKKCGN